MQPEIIRAPRHSVQFIKKNPFAKRPNSISQMLVSFSAAIPAIRRENSSN